MFKPFERIFSKKTSEKEHEKEEVSNDIEVIESKEGYNVIIENLKTIPEDENGELGDPNMLAFKELLKDAANSPYVIILDANKDIVMDDFNAVREKFFKREEIGEEKYQRLNSVFGQNKLSFSKTNAINFVLQNVVNKAEATPEFNKTISSIKESYDSLLENLDSSGSIKFEELDAKEKEEFIERVKAKYNSLPDHEKEKFMNTLDKITVDLYQAI